MGAANAHFVRMSDIHVCNREGPLCLPRAKQQVLSDKVAHPTISADYYRVRRKPNGTQCYWTNELKHLN